MFRTVAIASVAAAMFAFGAPANADETARCEATSFRVYFAHGSSRLNAAARETIEAAARKVEGCAYSELNVSVSGAYGARRAQAIRTAADDRAWDAVHVTPSMVVQAAYDAGPEYAEVTLATSPTPHQNMVTRDPTAGV
jgi:undecaprenyl pyrophosphate synthase